MSVPPCFAAGRQTARMLKLRPMGWGLHLFVSLPVSVFLVSLFDNEICDLWYHNACIKEQLAACDGKQFLCNICTPGNFPAAHGGDDLLDDDDDRPGFSGNQVKLVTKPRLSDRNCIEVVSKLIECGLIDVVCSTDAREYVTRQHLATQIKNECLANNGRVSLVDLQQVLNIEYQQIEDRATEIVRTDNNFILAVGQLISKEYLSSVCAEVNSKLTEEGKLHLSQITKSYDLPSDLLQNAIYEALGTSINGFSDKDDPSLLYTKDFVAQEKALIRGALSGLTKVTPLSRVISECSLQSSIFFSCLDDLLAEGQLEGSISGGRHIERAVYIPELYNTLVREYARDFYNQNKYIEFASLKKLGITTVSTFLSEVIPPADLPSLTHLTSGALSHHVWTQLQANVEEAMARVGWLDVGTVLPNELSDQSDVAIAADLLREGKDWKGCEDGVLYTDELVARCNRVMMQGMEDKVDQSSPDIQKLLKTLQNRQPAPQPDSAPKKRGKKGRGKRGAAEEEETAPQAPSFEFMSETEISATLQEENQLTDCPPTVLDQIAEHLKPMLNAKYREKLEAILVSTESDANAQHKKAHAQFQNDFRWDYMNICVFDQGAERFDDSTSTQLRQLLLRTLCVDAANLALAFISSTPNAQQLSAKVRDATIDALPSTPREAFQKLYASTQGKKDDLSEFFDAIDVVSGPAVCALNVKMPDKKTRSERVDRYRQDLERQLSESSDPASGLLLSLLFLIARKDQSAVHATGKFVPALLSQIQGQISKELAQLLLEMQQLVVASLKKGSNVDLDSLSEKFEALKSAVLNEE